MGVMALLIAMELFVLVFSVNTLSSVRAYVGAEGLWSKAQKDAIYNLRKYTRSGKEEDYQAFLYFLKVPLGDRVGRIEMAKKNPNNEIIRKSFLQGGNHPGDINGMIKLFSRFHSISYIHSAIGIWTEGDSLMAEFQKVADEIHSGILISGVSSYKTLENNLGQIDQLNTKFTVLENNFSATLGEGSRWLEGLLLKIILSIALTVEISGLLLTIALSRNITKDIGEILKTSEQIAEGNYNTKAVIHSEDEIGQLAISFNKMSEKLGHSISILQQTEIELKKGEESFFKIFENNPVAMTLSEMQTNKIKYANNLFCSTFGYTNEEVIGHTSDELNLISPEENERLRSLILGYLKEDRTFIELQSLSPDEREELLIKLKQSNKMKDLEVLYTKKNGESFSAIVSYEIIRIGNERYMVNSYQDISEIKKEKDKLKESEERFRLLVENVKDYAIILLDANGYIKTWNLGAERIKGYSAKEIIGKHISIMYTEEEKRNNEPENNLKKTKELGRYESEGWRVRKDGSEFFADVIYTALYDENNNFQGFSKITRDVTERRNAESEIKKKSEELIETNKKLAFQNEETEKRANELGIANKQLEQFVYIASHDLQEPLRTISNFVGLIDEELAGKLNKDTSEYLRFILGATSKMQNLIKALLDYSRLGKEITLEAVDCNNVVKEVIAEMAGSIKESNAKITSSPLPVIKGDEIQLKQLFQNLISNAIKFQKKNVTPVIEISVEEKDTEYVFAIKDNGIGIDEQNIGKLFIVFKRLHNDTEYPGNGIGLAICKIIVARHKGRIWVESKLGNGSTFYFSLPKDLS